MLERAWRMYPSLQHAFSLDTVEVWAGVNGELPDCGDFVISPVEVEVFQFGSLRYQKGSDVLDLPAVGIRRCAQFQVITVAEYGLEPYFCVKESSITCSMVNWNRKHSRS